MLSLATLAPTAARAQTQDLFLTNSDFTRNNTISRFASNGSGMFATNAMTLNDPILNSPQGLAFDTHGDLFAANYRGNNITEFAAGTTPDTLGATTILGDSSLSQPIGLALNIHGDLFIANLSGGNHFQGSITEFAAGATLGTFGMTTTLTDSSLNNPQGLECVFQMRSRFG